MANETPLYVRRAGLSLLRADAGLTAMVGDRMYPPQRPANAVWPFIGWGVAIDSPFAAACLDGNQLDVAVHCYAATSGTGSGTVAGEERAGAIAAGVVRVLLGAGEVALDAYGLADATAHFTWLSTQVIQDAAEADAFHAIVSLRVTVAA